MTGVGGTTYEISVWATGVLHDPSQRRGCHWTTCLHRAGHYLPRRLLKLERFSAVTDWRSGSWYSGYDLCDATGLWSSPAFTYWTKRNREAWVSFPTGLLSVHSATPWAIDWCDCNTAQLATVVSSHSYSLICCFAVVHEHSAECWQHLKKISSGCRVKEWWVRTVDQSKRFLFHCLNGPHDVLLDESFKEKESSLYTQYHLVL